MASNFKIKVLTSENPQAQYDAIVTKDAMTFYILNTGIGYLGSVKLFDATQSDSVIDNIVTDMNADDFVGDDISVATTKAIVDYVTKKVSSSTLTTSFFRHVESRTLTEEDLANENISMPEGCKAGDIGLMFTADTDNEDGGESYYFIPLTGYLQSVYGTQNSASINMTLSEDNKFKAELRIKEGEGSIKVDEENGGVYIEKTGSVINDGDGTDEGGIAPSETKLVTEAALINYIKTALLPIVNTTIQEALEDVVTAVIDDGTE